MDNKPSEAEHYTPESREDERNQLASDIEQFLSQGGTVREVPRGERADPPMRGGRYGSNGAWLDGTSAVSSLIERA